MIATTAYSINFRKIRYYANNTLHIAKQLDFLLGICLGMYTYEVSNRNMSN